MDATRTPTSAVCAGTRELIKRSERLVRLQPWHHELLSNVVYAGGDNVFTDSVDEFDSLDDVGEAPIAL